MRGPHNVMLTLLALAVSTTVVAETAHTSETVAALFDTGPSDAEGASASAGGGASSGASAPYPSKVIAPISAKGNPAYATDTNGLVIRGTQGECWRTGSWTPAQATVIGCDGVMAKATPVAAPAPSPKQPAPEAQTSPQSESSPPPLIAVPETQAPALAAGTAGAAASEKVTLDTDTYFDFDKATLKPEGESRLKEIANRVSSMKLEVVVATGYTDWTGTDAYNQKLSERRANTIKRFLANQGIPNKRIFIEGKGEKDPVTSNQTREGRAKNRRVVVELVGQRDR